MQRHQSPRKIITLADVARQAGVSQMTASKVMRKTGRISDATRERVHQAAVELGYVPNRLAGSLSSRSSDIVAVILPSINDRIYGDVVSGINSMLRPGGYLTFIGESHFDSALEEEIIQTVLSLHPAGIILTGGIKRTEYAARMLRNWDCPIVQIWDDADVGFDASVSPDHEHAGQLVARHFVERGFRRPAYIGAELDRDLCAARRCDAFLHAMRSAGLDPVVVTDAHLPRQHDSGRSLARTLMQARPDTDAIYCLNDAMALGALSWLHETGFAVPEQVAVAGFNGTSLLNVVRTRLTTVQVDCADLGKIAAEAVVSLLGQTGTATRTTLPSRLLIGNTS